MEKLYEDKNIKADCEVMEEYIDSYNQPNEPFSQRCSVNSILVRLEGQLGMMFNM